MKNINGSRADAAAAEGAAAHVPGSDAAATDPLSIIILESPRDRAALAYLRRIKDDATISSAASTIVQRGQRPYISNIFKLLHIKQPPTLTPTASTATTPMPPELRARLEELKTQLNYKRTK